MFSRHQLLALAACLLFTVAFALHRETGGEKKLVYETGGQSALTGTNNAPVFESRTIMHYDSGFAHSPAIIEHADGSLQAVWYQGNNEADHSMGLDSARFSGGEWVHEGKILTAASETAERGYYIQTIGNPVLMHGPGSAVWLFYVTPSMGGWSTARVSMRQSGDNGRTFTDPKTLVTEPFFNMSTHVRFPGGRLSGGGYYLPAYHELAVKFPELLHLDSEGNVAGRLRIGGFGSHGIQASVSMQNPTEGKMFIRSVKSMPGYVHVAQTTDGGESWSLPVPSTLESVGSPACSIALPSGDIVIGYNPGTGRSVLKFVLFDAKLGSFRDLDHQVGAAQDKGANTYCYGYTSRDGYLHFVFSRTGLKSIEHVRFNQSWVYRD